MAYRLNPLDANNQLSTAFLSAMPRKASVSDAQKADTTTPEKSTKTTDADTVSFTEKTTSVTKKKSTRENKPTLTEAQKTDPQRFSLAPLVTACGGLLGIVFGGVGGYYAANALGATALENPAQATANNNQSTQTLEAIEQTPVYLKKSGETLVLNTDKLTATSNADNQYYEFTPKAIVDSAPKPTFEIIHHQQTPKRQVQYLYENPALVEGSTNPLKAKLKQINILTPNGLNECVTLNAQGQPIRSVKTIQTTAGSFENHEWLFSYDTYNRNRTVERQTVYPATKNATGGGYNVADNAVAKSVTYSEKIFNDTTGFLTEIQILEKGGNAERLLFDAQGKVTERYGSIAKIQVERLEKLFEAKLSGQLGWFDQFYDDFLTYKPTNNPETGQPNPLPRGVKTYETAQQWERQAVQTIRGALGIDKLTSSTDVALATNAEVALATVHPQTKLRTAIGEPTFSGGEPLLKSVTIAWQQFKVAYKETGGKIAEQSVGDRFNQLAQAFKETSTGQKIGLGVGAVLGGALGIWALFPKKSRTSATTDTN